MINLLAAIEAPIGSVMFVAFLANTENDFAWATTGNEVAIFVNDIIKSSMQ